VCNYFNRYTILTSPSVAVVAFSVCLTGQAFAQDIVAPAVEVGAITKQTDEARPVLEGSGPRDGAAIVLPSLPQDILDNSTPAPGAPTLFLRAWEFSGNALFDTEALRAVLASVTGRDLTINQLYSAARAIEAYYAVSGYVAQATLPPQEVVNGIVRIEIVEAKYAGVEFEGDLPTRVRPETIRGVFEAHVPSGAPLKPAEFDLPNLLVNDLPGVAVTGAFAPGRNPGETVLLLDTFDYPFVFGQVLMDNTGSRATGAERVVAQFGLNSPLGYGDLLRADIAKSEGSASVSGSYSIPLGSKGSRLTINGSRLTYDVVTPEMRDLDVSGESLTRGLSFSMPLRRSRDLNVNLNLSHTVADLENSVRGDVVSDYRVRQSSIGVSGNWRDQFGGAALTSFGLSLASGSARGTGSSGAFDDGFDVLRLNLEREQYLTDVTSFFVGFSGQYGSRGLDSSEQFSLGGPSGVRAYPVGEAGGPSGAILNLEVRHQLSPQWRLTGFYDHGVVSDRDAPNEPSSYQLKGLGATLSWAGPDGWGADLTWARRIGSNPNPIVDVNRGALGNDQDGSLDKNRLWFAVRKTF
jgi:hemolysin activation/secretion protein